MPTAALESAFRATRYRVSTALGVFDLRVGVYDVAFERYLCQQGIADWGIVTAFNPGRRVTDAENRQAQMRLRNKLEASACVFLAACNLAEGEAWPPEESFFVASVDEDWLRALAGEFSQLAFICGAAGAAPRLVWIGPGAVRMCS